MAKRPPSMILPHAMYSLRGFQEASGVTSARMSELKQQGLRPTTLKLGRRVFIRGADAIAYIEAAAAMASASGSSAPIES